MIIGNDREAVIENIRTAAESGDFYKKVEIGDPVLTREQSDEIVYGYLSRRRTLSYKFKSFTARKIADVLTYALNRKTEIIGIEKAKGIKGGAIVTSNHFSPTENTAVRHLVKKLGKKRINIVSQETNLAMPGIVGFLMNYADVIPVNGNFKYMKNEFQSVLSELVGNGEYVLIYPEQEMWFNYRKPRPPKRGAYYYAATLGVPVICCFVEMSDLGEVDSGDFNKIQFKLHILDVLYPDKSKSIKENSELMMRKDYELKKAAYEKAYGKELRYDFDNSDIAGWRK